MPTDDFLAYQEARARGGAAAIFIEATAVHETGLLTSHSIAGFDPAVVPVYRRIGDALRSNGAALFLQLFHGGRERITAPPRPAAVAPSAVPSPRFHVEPRALTRRDIADLVAAFADCAAKARAGGVDGLEVSFSHGYLGAQFFSPMTNLRDDEYDLEHGLRFGREVLAAVREAAGDRVAVGVRLAADEGPTGALGPAACARIARGLCGDGLVDFVDLALGYSATLMGSVGIVPPPPVERNAIAEPAGAVRAVLPGLPMIATTRVVELADAERLLADGQADVIGMTRAMIADPDLLAKAAAGREDEILHCIGCNQGCIGHYHAGTPIGCIVNPRTGRERTLPRPVAGSSHRDVLVIGAGPAGDRRRARGGPQRRSRHAARAADAIGGQLRLAGRAPAHAETWEVYARDVERDLAAAGVDVRLGTAATSADADGRDLVVLATGARPFEPRLHRDLPFRLVQAWDAIADPAAIVGPVLVADWGGGYEGLDAAELLAAAGHDVELACGGADPRRGRAPVPAQPLPGAARRGRRADPAPPRRCPRTGTRCAMSSPAGRSRSTPSRRSSSPRDASPTTHCGRRSRAARASSAPATCSARDRPRRRSWKAPSPCGRLAVWASSGAHAS